MAGLPPAIRARADGVTFAVHVTPKAGRDAVEGWMKDGDGLDMLKVKVRSAPSDGEANEAVTAVLAQTLKIAKSRLAIAKGHRSPRKIVDANGDPALLTARLTAFGDAV